MVSNAQPTSKKLSAKVIAWIAAGTLVLGMIPIAGIAWAWGEKERTAAPAATDPVAALHDDQALLSSADATPVSGIAGTGLADSAGNAEGFDASAAPSDATGQPGADDVVFFEATIPDAGAPGLSELQPQDAGASDESQSDDPCVNGTCTHQAAIGATHYDMLKDAVNDAVNDDVVTLVSDIAGMSTDDIATIDTGKSIVLDMAGHSITVAQDFAGRPIVNKGTLGVTGNGVIDSSASEGGYGAIRNDGTLTVMDGRYVGNVMADGAAIRNGIGSHLVVYDGYFAGTGAVYNAGEAVIYKGEFVTLACSGCGTPFAYALNNRDENGTSGTMQILPENDEDVKVHGTQGALASAGGANVYVKGGTFYTHPCANNHAGSTFYALYVSGKEGMDAATCVVDGGKFSTTGANACMYLVNENPSDNGGNPGKAVVQINGGSFDQGPARTLANFGGKQGGTLTINGGVFTGVSLDSVTPYIDPASTQTHGDNAVAVAPRTAQDLDTVAEVGGKYYALLQDAVNAAAPEATVTLLADAGWSAADGSIEVEKTLAIDLAGHNLNITGVGTNCVKVCNGGNLAIRNGSITANEVAKPQNPVFETHAGSSLALSGIRSFDTNGTALFAKGEGATLTVDDSVVNTPNSYVVSTNANSTDNHGVAITLRNSTFAGNTPILLNVPGNLTVDNCTVSGLMQGIVVRGGTASITNSTVSLNYPGNQEEAESMANYFADRNWGSGNMVNLGAITIGNKGNGYQYPSDVHIANSVVKVEGEHEAKFPCVYVWANESEGNGVTLTMTEVTFQGGTDPQVVFGNEKANVVEKTSVAKVDGAYFDSLQAAIDAAAEGATVTLVADVSMDNSAENRHVSVAKKLTIDLNGHDVDRGSNNIGYALVTVAPGGDLTLQGDGVMDGKPAFMNNGKSYFGEGVRVQSAKDSAAAGKLTIKEGVTVRGGYAVRVNAGASAAIDGATVEGATYGILASGAGADVQVNGGSVTSVSNAAIQAQLGANVAVNGGTVSSPKSAIIGLTNNQDAMGTVAINGGVVESASYGEEHPENFGAVVANSYHVTVSGGEIRAPYAVQLSTFNGNEAAATSGTSTFDMTGGSIVATIQGVGVNNLKSAGARAGFGGGTVSVPTGTAIYWPAEGVLTIGGNAVIEGLTGIEARMGTIVIEGGFVSGMGTPMEGLPSSGSARPEGSALLVCTQMYDQCVSEPELTVLVSGGTLSNPLGHAVTVQNMRVNEVSAEIRIAGGAFVGAQDAEALVEKVADGEKANVTTVSISGGTFTSKVLERHCVRGFIPVTLDDGLYGVEEYAEHIKDHKWGEWETVVAPTCTEAGMRMHTCTACGERASETVPAVGHGWGTWVTVTNPTCTSAGVQTRTCATCEAGGNQLLPALGHDWGAWTVLRPASAGVEGVEQSVCSHDVTHIMTRTIAALPSAPQGGNSGGNTGGNTGGNAGGSSGGQSGNGGTSGGYIPVYTPVYIPGATTVSRTTTVDTDDGPVEVVNDTATLQPADQGTDGTIVDDETPLASRGTDRAKSTIADDDNPLSGTGSTSATSEQGVAFDWLPIAIGASALLLALAGGCFLVFFLKRRKSEQQEDNPASAV